MKRKLKEAPEDYLRGTLLCRVVGCVAVFTFQRRKESRNMRSRQGAGAPPWRGYSSTSLISRGRSRQPRQIGHISHVRHRISLSLFNFYIRTCTHLNENVRAPHSKAIPAFWQKFGSDWLCVWTWVYCCSSVSRRAPRSRRAFRTTASITILAIPWM